MDKEKGIRMLISWDMVEQRKQYPRDKVILVALIGGTAAILAIVAKTYIFALLIIIATVFFIYTGKQKPRTLSFKITSKYIKLAKDTLPIEDITAYNIIEQPGERDLLLLRTKKLLTTNEIIPIYDVTREQIEQALREIHIQKNETLALNIPDKINLNL